MNEGKKDELIRMLREDLGSAPPAISPGDTFTISGNGNSAFIANHSTVHVHHRPKVIANIRPGEVHISHEQAARLKTLVLAAVRATSKSYQAVWTALHEHMVVPQYRLIPAAAFNDAVRQLERWIHTGRLSA